MTTVYAQPGIIAAGDLHLVKAKVTDISGKPVAGAMTYVSVAASGFQLRTGISDQDGNLQYIVPNLPEKGQFVFQADNRRDSGLVFTVENKFVTPFGSEATTESNYDIGDTTHFYGAPDKAYLLDDYTRFASLEEVFREFITEVKISKQGSNFRLNVLNKPFRIYFENEPLVLLDGIPVFDHNKLLDIDPLKIKSIDVIARKYYLGSLLCNGIVSLYSFDGDMAGYTLPFRALVTEFNLQGR